MEQITLSNFKETVDASVVLIDCYADWCAPCKAIAPVLEELSTELPNVKFVKLDVDSEHMLARGFDIKSIPTLLLVKDGKVEKRSVGALPKEQIKSFILE